MIDANMLIAPIISALVTGVVTGVGIYVAMSNRLTKLETLMTTFMGTIDKYNNVVERTFKLESDLATMWLRQDELKQELRDIKEDIK